MQADQSEEDTGASRLCERTDFPTCRMQHLQTGSQDFKSSKKFHSQQSSKGVKCFVESKSYFPDTLRLLIYLQLITF